MGAKAVKMRMPTSTVGKSRNRNRLKRERGFTYTMVLVAIVVIGILAGVANISTAHVVQRDREEELMFRGIAYRNAIQHYYAVARRYPRSLSDLVKDSRFAHHIYLRTLYADPMAGREGEERSKSENGGWQLIRAADGGIAGVASHSRQKPIKKANFPPGFENFEGAKSYAEWAFEYAPLAAGASTNSMAARAVSR
jgi:type II secretory pathway pseudopilin PulG